MNRPLLSLVVCVRHADDNFDVLLRDITATRGLDSVQLIIVGVASVTSTQQIDDRLRAHGLHGRALVLVAQGLATARRLGVAHAEGEWVLLWDEYVSPGPGEIDRILASLRAAGAEADCFVVSKNTTVRRASQRRAAPTVDEQRGVTELLAADITQIVFRRHDVPRDGIAINSEVDAALVVDLFGAQRGSAPSVCVLDDFRLERRSRRGVDEETAHFRANVESYRRLLAQVSARLAAPDTALWRQKLLIRELRLLVAFEHDENRYAAALTGESGELFAKELGDVLRQFERGVLIGPDDGHASDEVRDAMLGLRGEEGAARVAHIADVDASLGAVKLLHNRWTGYEPQVADAPSVAYSKHRAVRVFGVTVFSQWIAWIPVGADLRVITTRLGVELRAPGGALLTASRSAVEFSRAIRRYERRLYGLESRTPRPSIFTRTFWRSAVGSARKSWLSRAALTRLISRLPWVAGRYDGAWLFMDRADSAGDNAEALFRWVTANHPEINAWFVVRSDASDFSRLQRDGLPVVAYGSTQHHLLLHRARHYLSSHAGLDVSRPVFDRYLITEPPWEFTFLQHGVIHNDVSAWLNRQRMRLCITSTHAEFRALTADDSPYAVTEREVRLTGMPRLDRIRRLADAAPVVSRRSIVIAPTWRNGLLQPAESPGTRRRAVPGAEDSKFVRTIMELLAHPQLCELAEEGYSITFVPHPNAVDLFPRRELPPHVGVTTYQDGDGQALVASASVVVTDFSSVAFDAAFADAAVVYLQPDAIGEQDIEHSVLPGYFNFESDGFGPICDGVDEAIEAVLTAVNRRHSAVYRERARAAFAFWDAGSSQRVFESVKATDSRRQ